MTDENFALLRTHRNNISRYRRLLKTNLTEFERQFIERRLAEERSAMENLAASTFPLTFQVAAKEVEISAPGDYNPYCKYSPQLSLTDRADSVAAGVDSWMCTIQA